MAGRFRQMLGAATVATALAGCQDGLDFDVRRSFDTIDTTDAAVDARTAARPVPDGRGVISYPTYQVAVAQPGDDLAAVAARVGVPAVELARYNGLSVESDLRRGEIVALPAGTTTAPAATTGAVSTATIATPGQVDVATIAGSAIQRADSASGPTPVRHRVAPGETAFSIARRYGVSVDALAEWNGLGGDRSVREGQFLLIPPAAPAPVVDTALPGRGSTTPTPPSADEPLPEDDTAAPVVAPAAPDLAQEATAASDTGRMLTPVAGQIVRGYDGETNEGIDISGTPGGAVRAAASGTVAAITRDTDDGVPIVVIRHEGSLLTVYDGVQELAVAQGDTVSRGETIGTLGSGSPAVLHFEVREGFNHVDPEPYLN